MKTRGLCTLVRIASLVSHTMFHSTKTSTSHSSCTERPARMFCPCSCRGPTNAYASSGRFGAAAYFAEDVGKSDQYCKLQLDYYHRNIDMDKGDNGEIKKMLGITPDMYADAAVSAAGDKDVFYMFVVRVALGCPARVRANDYDENKAGKPGTDAYTSGKLMHDGSSGSMSSAKDLDRQFQSVIVDDWGYYAAANLRFREFMVYNNGVGMVAKITHIVAYKRMRGAAAGVKYGSAFEDPLSIKWPDHTVAPPWERPVVSALLTSTELPVDELSEMDMHTLEEPPAVATPPPAAAAAASSSGGGFAAIIDRRKILQKTFSAFRVAERSIGQSESTTRSIPCFRQRRSLCGMA